MHLLSLDVVKDTSQIVFNMNKLTLGETRVTSAALKEDIVQASSELKIDAANERVALELPVTLPAGSQLQLKVDFAGELTGDMMGYYRSAWEHEGKTQHYALTQFEVRINIFLCTPRPELSSRYEANSSTKGIPMLGRASSQGHIWCNTRVSRRDRQLEQHARCL